jgi:hypothetical protein
VGVNAMEINELQVHKAIVSEPELIESKLGIKLAADSLRHHYPLSSKGEHIDFVFEDIAGNIYLAEVKIQTSPISVIPQLYGHEYKKFVELNPDIDQQKIIPVIIIDVDSVTDQDLNILNKMGIGLCTYQLQDVKKILEKKKPVETEISLDFPEVKELEDFLNKAKTIQENFGDINFILEGFKGKHWYDGYYDFRVFWLWKDGNYPEPHQKIFEMLCAGQRENCLWFTFFTSVSDSFAVAEHIVMDQKWTWNKVLSALGKKPEWHKFEDCLCNSGKWCIVALLDFEKRKKVIKDYLKKVGESQEKYFQKIMSKSKNPFDAYNGIRQSLYSIKNIGNVVAGEFATYLSQWRILPIIPSDQIRESKFVKKALVLSCKN